MEGSGTGRRALLARGTDFCYQTDRGVEPDGLEMSVGRTNGRQTTGLKPLSRAGGEKASPDEPE